ncbi:MAG: aspartate/glutamate racemase family protein [Thermoanaerobaculia bacterium]|nr:aspartate/glutamate racemase family protein [Thermoanaerobaculia bacterium]
MRTIGLIGGMSWESTVSYYQTINRVVGDRLGGLHSARIVIYSVDFQEIEELQRKGDWNETGRILGEAAVALRAAGAEFLVLATNTMHKVAEAITDASHLPVLHIADATAEAVESDGIDTVGLLGTRYTMEQDFYRARLEEKHGLRVLVPDENDRRVVNDTIFDELCRGRILDGSRNRYVRIIESLVDRGAEGIILGCTEIGLLVGEENSSVPIFDTSRIHAEAAALEALNGD